MIPSSAIQKASLNPTWRVKHRHNTAMVKKTDNLKYLPLRSPREAIAGYILLPRLIDKIRLHARGELPQEYVTNLLKPGKTLDGRFLTFTGLSGEVLQKTVISSDTDKVVIAWIKKNVPCHTEDEKQAWAKGIDTFRPNADLKQYREGIYPELASRIDVGNISVLDLIDLDEGRILVSEWISENNNKN